MTSRRRSVIDSASGPIPSHRFCFRTDPKPGFDGITHCVRYRLEPIEKGTRLHVERTGFSGLRAYLISFLMQMGIRGMYNQQLPAVLDELQHADSRWRS